MSLTRPRVGMVEAEMAAGPTTVRATAKRPNPLLHATGEGLHVLLRRVEGVTRKGALTTPFLFQVPPLETFTWAGGSSWDDYDTEGGPRSRRGKRLLRSFSFRSLFVAEQATYTLVFKTGWRPNPILMLRELEDLCGGALDSKPGSAFRVSVFTPILFDQADVDMLVTLRSYEVENIAGEPDTRYYTLGFTEYNPAGPVTLVGAGKTPAGYPHLPATVKVSGNDTMHSLAKTYYADPSRWTLIAKQNGLRVSPSEPLGPVLAASGRISITVPAAPPGA